MLAALARLLGACSYPALTKASAELARGLRAESPKLVVPVRWYSVSRDALDTPAAHDFEAEVASMAYVVGAVSVEEMTSAVSSWEKAVVVAIPCLLIKCHDCGREP